MGVDVEKEAAWGVGGGPAPPDNKVVDADDTNEATSSVPATSETQWSWGVSSQPSLEGGKSTRSAGRGAATRGKAGADADATDDAAERRESSSGRGSCEVGGGTRARMRQTTARGAGRVVVVVVVVGVAAGGGERVESTAGSRHGLKMASSK